MNLNKLDLTVTRDDLQSLVNRYIPSDKGISDIRVEIASDVIIKGKYTKLVEIPFSVLIQISHTDTEIHAKIAHVGGAAGFGNTVKKYILQKLGQKLSVPGVTVNRSTININPNVLMHSRGLDTKLSIDDIQCLENSIHLSASGQLTM